MKYVRLYCDEAGESHFEDIEVAMFPLNYAPPAPSLDLSEPMAASKVLFMHVPAGWTGEWHRAPRKQFLFRLAGIFESTASDGETRLLGPGSVLLMEDIHGKGHYSRVVGDIDALNAVVPIE